jgi:predicted DNA-binding transcriptional regulator AlpA
MSLFEFSIIASGLDPAADDFESRFYDNGCDDATVSFQKGHIIIDFAREAISIEDAIASAVENVRAAGATVDRVEPDPLVSLSEIAARTGLTRAAISLYAKGQRGTAFPAPVARITSDSPLWDWAEIAKWFFSLGRMSKEDAIAAKAVTVANYAIDASEPHFQERLKHDVGECRAAL